MFLLEYVTDVDLRKTIQAATWKRVNFKQKSNLVHRSAVKILIIDRLHPNFFPEIAPTGESIF